MAYENEEIESNDYGDYQVVGSIAQCLQKCTQMGNDCKSVTIKNESKCYIYSESYSDLAGDSDIDCSSSSYDTFQKCFAGCQTCSNEPTNCGSCNSPSTRSSSMPCYCLDGYYEKDTVDCGKCLNNCVLCQESEDHCTECKISPSTRHNTLPECACIDKFYDDGANADCLPCLDICAKCIEGEYCTECILEPTRDENNALCLCKFDLYQIDETLVCTPIEKKQQRCIFDDTNLMVQQWQTYHVNGIGDNLVDGIFTKQAYDFSPGGQYRGIVPMIIGDKFSVSFWIKFKSYQQEGIVCEFNTENPSYPDNFYIATLNSPKKGIGIFYKFYYLGEVKLNSYFHETKEQDIWVHYVFIAFDNGYFTIFKNNEKVVGRFMEFQSISSQMIKKIYNTSRRNNYFGKNLDAVVDQFRVYYGALSDKSVECLNNQCSYTCDICEFQSDVCKTCAGNRVGLPQCNCPAAHYDDGYHTNCNKRQTCKTITKNKVIRIDNYKDYEQLPTPFYVDCVGAACKSPISRKTFQLDGEQYLKSYQEYEIQSQFSVNFWLKYKIPLDTKITSVVMSLNNDQDLQNRNAFIISVSQKDPLSVLMINNISKNKYGLMENEQFGVYEIIQEGVFCHIEVVVDNYHISVYKDGVLQNKFDSEKQLSQGPKEIFWGKAPDWASLYLQNQNLEGYIDEMILYNKVINAQEAMCLANKCLDIYDFCHRESNIRGLRSNCLTVRTDDLLELTLEPSELTTTDQYGPVSESGFKMRSMLEFLYTDEEISLQQQFSVAIWAKIENPDIFQQYYIHMKSVDPTYYEFYLARHQRTNNILAYFYDEDLGNSYELLCSDCIKLATWQHIAFVVQDQVWKFYIDGQESSYFQDMGFSMPDISYNDTYVGDSMDHAGFGEVDDFRLYTVALNFQEIKCLNDQCEAGIQCKNIALDNGLATCNLRSDKCKKCLNNRIGEFCECPARTFDIRVGACPYCSWGCEVCENKKVCNTCAPSTPERVLERDCACPHGWYDNFKEDQCKQCIYYCQKCENYKTECTECDSSEGRRDDPPYCSCDLGYYENPALNKCSNCRLDHNAYCTDCSLQNNNLQCHRCTGNRELPYCICPKNMVPDPSDPDYCIFCNQGDYYLLALDECRNLVINPKLDCIYADICLECKVEANIHCLNCQIEERTTPPLQCNSCEANRVLPSCICPKFMAPSEDNPAQCTKCLPGTYYKLERDLCRTEGLKPKLDCLYTDICKLCTDDVNIHCQECSLITFLSCTKCPGNRMLPDCQCPINQVANPDNPALCIKCRSGTYYDLSLDLCQGGHVDGNGLPKLDCQYDDICRKCKDDINMYCLECGIESSLQCNKCAGNRVLPHCLCPDSMAPDPSNPENCILCERGRYYNATMDTCREEGQLECLYDDICRKCDEDTNRFCLQCDSFKEGYPICNECAGNRVFRDCKCEYEKVPSKQDDTICVFCQKDEFYNLDLDMCSLDKDNQNIDCKYEDICLKCEDKVHQFCLECLIRKSDQELVCLLCQGDLVYLHEEKQCRCGDGTYSFDTQSTQCKNCVDHALCENGMEMNIAQGYWRNGNLTDSIQQCSNMPQNCKGGKTNNLCHDGYVGALCEACDRKGEVYDGKIYGREGDYQCAECDYTNGVIKIIGIVGTMIISAFMLEWSTIKSVQQNIQNGCFEKIIKNRSYERRQQEQAIYIKILIHYMYGLQVILTFNIKLPGFLRGLSAAGSPAKLSSYAFDCFIEDMKNKQFTMFKSMESEYFALIVQFFIIIICFFICFLILLVLKRKKIFTLTIGQILSANFIHIFIFFQPSYVQLLVDSIACKRILGKLYLNYNTSQECYTDNQLKYAYTFIIPLILIMVLLIPFLLFRQLKKADKSHRYNIEKPKQNKISNLQILLTQESNTQQSEKIQNNNDDDNEEQLIKFCYDHDNHLSYLHNPVCQYKYGFLYLEYNMYFWEFVKIFEKLMILIVLSFHASEIKIKGILVFVIIFFYGLLIIVFKPYKKRQHNKIDLIATSVGGITIILAIFIYQNYFPGWVGIALFFMVGINILLFGYICYKILEGLYYSNNIEHKIYPHLHKLGKVGSKIKSLIDDKKEMGKTTYENWQTLKDRVNLFTTVKKFKIPELQSMKNRLQVLYTEYNEDIMELEDKMYLYKKEQSYLQKKSFLKLLEDIRVRLGMPKRTRVVKEVAVVPKNLLAVKLSKQIEKEDYYKQQNTMNSGKNSVEELSKQSLDTQNNNRDEEQLQQYNSQRTGNLILISNDAMESTNRQFIQQQQQTTMMSPKVQNTNQILISQQQSLEGEEEEKQQNIFFNNDNNSGNNYYNETNNGTLNNSLQSQQNQSYQSNAQLQEQQSINIQNQQQQQQLQQQRYSLKQIIDQNEQQQNLQVDQQQYYQPNSTQRSNEMQTKKSLFFSQANSVYEEDPNNNNHDNGQNTENNYNIINNNNGQNNNYNVLRSYDNNNSSSRYYLQNNNNNLYSSVQENTILEESQSFNNNNNTLSNINSNNQSLNINNQGNFVNKNTSLIELQSNNNSPKQFLINPIEQKKAMQNIPPLSLPQQQMSSTIDYNKQNSTNSLIINNSIKHRKINHSHTQQSLSGLNQIPSSGSFDSKNSISRSVSQSTNSLKQKKYKGRIEKISKKDLQNQSQKYRFELYNLLPGHVKQYVKFSNTKKVKELIQQYNVEEKYLEQQKKQQQEEQEQLEENQNQTIMETEQEQNVQHDQSIVVENIKSNELIQDQPVINQQSVTFRIADLDQSIEMEKKQQEDDQNKDQDQEQQQQNQNQFKINRDLSMYHKSKKQLQSQKSVNFNRKQNRVQTQIIPQKSILKQQGNNDNNQKKVKIRENSHSENNLVIFNSPQINNNKDQQKMRVQKSLKLNKYVGNNSNNSSKIKDNDNSKKGNSNKLYRNVSQTNNQQQQSRSRVYDLNNNDPNDGNNSINNIFKSQQ